MKLNHLALTVRDCEKSRDWYQSTLGLRVEFENLDDRFVAMEEDTGFGFLLSEGEPLATAGADFSIYFEVENVDALYARVSALGVAFAHPPRRERWGYGPELRDPDGYVLRFFDYRSITAPE